MPSKNLKVIRVPVALYEEIEKRRKELQAPDHPHLPLWRALESLIRKGEK